MFTLIACADKNNGIGYNSHLLVSIPEDMARFKKLTSNHTVIMGRNTYESIGHPLENRNNIVLSTKDFPPDFSLPNAYVEFCNSVDNLIDRYKYSTEEVFVIGGAKVYEQFLPHAAKIYLTRLENPFYPVDAYFPELDTNWLPVKIKYNQSYKNPKDGDILNYSFIDYKNKDFYLSKDEIVDKEDFEKFIDKEDCETKEDCVTKADVDARADEGFDSVNKPSHYADGKIEVIDFIEDKKLGFHLGNVVKYVARAGKKCPGDIDKEIQDLEKAKWYLKRRIKFLKKLKKTLRKKELA